MAAVARVREDHRPWSTDSGEFVAVSIFCRSSSNRETRSTFEREDFLSTASVILLSLLVSVTTQDFVKFWGNFFHFYFA
jgi:hypothetical protein